MSLRAQPYRPELQREWDDFVRASRNGTFLFERDYMDYHSDRFTDASLMVRDAKEALVALLPGCVIDGVYVSHGGLTYGGVVAGAWMTAERMLDVLDVLLSAAFALDVRGVIYKPVPHMYHREPSEEDLWALHRAGGRLLHRDVSSALYALQRGAVQQRRKRGAKRARAVGALVEESSNWAAFWDVLAETLRMRHSALPVHSLEEITLLRQSFPARIRLFTAQREGRVLAGAVIFDTDTVAHVQYIASTEDGRRDGALDLLFDQLLTGEFSSKPVFDFGTSMEPASGDLNAGNCAFKEGFGARTVVYDTYLIERGDRHVY
jgi:hypothetical protein